MANTATRQSSRRRFARPTVVVSSCLLGIPVRWDGTPVSCPFVQQLRPFVKVIPVCPEVAIGLGVPRDPIRLVATGDSARLVQPSSGRKLTRAMKNFSRQFVDSLDDVDGYILKARSPSCGLNNIKLFETAAGTEVVGRAFGLFAGEVIRNSYGLPVADERMLETARYRHHFLTRLFRLAAYRAVARTGTTKNLLRFHRENYLLLEAHNRSQLKLLDKIVRDTRETRPDTVFDLYRIHLLLALRRPMRNMAGIDNRQQENRSVAAKTLIDPFPAKLRKMPTSRSRSSPVHIN